MTMTALRPAPTTRPPLPPTPTPLAHTATAALVLLWDSLSAMRTDDARTFLTGTGAAFLPGVEVEQLLTDMHRDSVRRRFTGVQR